MRMLKHHVLGKGRQHRSLAGWLASCKPSPQAPPRESGDEAGCEQAYSCYESNMQYSVAQDSKSYIMELSRHAIGQHLSHCWNKLGPNRLWQWQQVTQSY